MESPKKKKCSSLLDKVRGELLSSLSPHFVLAETVLGAIAVCTNSKMLLTIKVVGKKIDVWRMFNSATLLETTKIKDAVAGIVEYCESRIDELNPMDDVPKNGKPVLVLIQKTDSVVFRVGYFQPNYGTVGDAFDFDRHCLGWLPIEGIKYD